MGKRITDPVEALAEKTAERVIDLVVRSLDVNALKSGSTRKPFSTGSMWTGCWPKYIVTRCWPGSMWTRSRTGST